MKLYSVKNELNRQEKLNAVEASLLLGFQTVQARFPVITESEETELPESMEEIQKLWNLSGIEAPEGYVSASEKAGDIFDLEFRQKKGLEYLFLKGRLLKDNDHDLLPDCLDVKFLLPEHVDRGMLLAACNLAFRLGMETTRYEGSVVASNDYDGNLILFEDGDTPKICYEEDENRIKVHIVGRGEELLQFIAELCNSFPKLNVMRSWRDVLMDMVDDFVLRGKDGQLAAVHMLSKTDQESYTLYGAPDIEERQKEYLDNCTFYNYKSGRKMYEKVYDLPWEVDTFQRILKEKIYPNIVEGSSVKIEAALSESPKYRARLMNVVKEELCHLGCSWAEVHITCAYKQGFSWLTEQVVPKLQGEQKNCIHKMEIYFKPFLPEGETEWVDENGATPSYHNLKAENPEKWYDLPIRYLQELYPAMDVIRKELNLTEDQIVFLPYEGEKNITYLCKVYDESDKLLLEETQKVYCSERPYLDEYPGLGKVHPSTGFVRVEVDGEEVLFQTIRTDLEEVWEIYQTEVLPDCRKYIEMKHNGSVKAENQPLFYKLLLDVSVSEPDYRVGCREDMISSLDALHEDLYFTGSDYFKNYGIHYGDGMLDAPGLILPEIHNTEGEKPRFRVVLYEPLKAKACVMKDEQVLLEQSGRENAQAWLSEISWNQGTLQYTVQTEGVADSFLESYAYLTENRVLSIADKLGRCEVIFRDLEGNAYSAKLEEEPIKKNRRIEEIDLLENELIGYEDYLKIIDKLKEVPQIEVFESATSYSGRKIYAIWLKPKMEGYLSMTKRLSMIPSEIINARHHANEVSSTNASFILLKELLTEDKYRDLPEKLNLILVPMENVDGAAIHYELQKEHPYWKFHVARFNSLGKEFYHEHFKPDTLHTEAMGLSRLYERFVPDVLPDRRGTQGVLCRENAG